MKLFDLLKVNMRLHLIGACAECDHSGECDIERFVFRSPEYTNPEEFGCSHFQLKEREGTT